MWNSKKKPYYGMRGLDAILEERASNRLELTGPLMDTYLCEIGKGIHAKLGRSRNTGLMPPMKLFVPHNILRHLFNIAVGYGGKLTSDKKTMTVTISTFENASKVFSPVRCAGTNFLKKRQFEKVTENGRKVYRYSGRAAVVISQTTPLLFEYNMKQQKLTTTCYIQRYNKDDFALDLRLQALVNNTL